MLSSLGGFNPTILTLPFAMVVLVMASFAYSSCVMSGVQVEMQKICRSISDGHPQLSFHVRFERHDYSSGEHNPSSTTRYIEVSINNTGYNNQKAEIAMTQATGVAESAFRASPAERLVELDKMRYSLTQGEFETKRAEILDSV
mmetsp:Transcript_65/g.115  ORF Transcript_65/g.115 Transcript_65/m.115 type:complete len:144 (+) Transcript_65:288-719(+)